MNGAREVSQWDHELVRDLVSFFAGRSEISAAYLFGSRVRGVIGRRSDVDVGVLLQPEAYKRAQEMSHWGYKAELDVAVRRALKRRDIDLVVLNQAGIVLADEVIARGRLLVCKDESYRIAFEVDVLLRYLDTEPLRKLFAEELDRRLKEGRFGKT